MRFIEYLIFEQEVNVTVSGEDPAGSMAKAKQMARQAAGDPERALKQREKNLKDRAKVIAQEDDPDIRRAEEDILKDEQRITQRRRALEKDRERKQIEKARTAGVPIGEMGGAP